MIEIFDVFQKKKSQSTKKMILSCLSIVFIVSKIKSLSFGLDFVKESLGHN